MKKNILLAILLSCSGPLGCAAAIPVIAKVATAVADAGTVLSIIRQAVSSWFKVNPDLEREQMADRLIQNATIALRTATYATNGATSLSQEEYDKAFSDFREAYGELHSFLSENGLLQGSLLSSGNGSSVEIPTPLALEMRM